MLVDVGGFWWMLVDFGGCWRSLVDLCWILMDVHRCSLILVDFWWMEERGNDAGRRAARAIEPDGSPRGQGLRAEDARGRWPV